MNFGQLITTKFKPTNEMLDTTQPNPLCVCMNFFLTRANLWQQITTRNVCTRVNVTRPPLCC